MTVIQSLQQLNLYPIPDSVVTNICEERGLVADDEVTTEIRAEKEYKLATANVYKWLAFAPTTVSQGGVTFSISESDKKRFLELANQLYSDNEEQPTGAVYGYKGSRL